MKKTLLIAALSISVIGNSQSLTQTNEPAIGESVSMYLCDSFTVAYEGVTGPAVTWDYTNLVGIFGETRDVEVINATTAPNSTDFPTSTKALSVEGSMTSYFNSSASDRVSQGFVFTEPTMGEIVAKFNTNNETIVTYPFAYGNSLNDVFSGDVTSALSGTTALTGNVNATIDGQGTLNLPLGISLPNVIRYKIVDTSNTNAFGQDIEIVRNQYEYYDLVNSNLPVLSIASLSISGIVDLQESLVLSAYPTSEFLSLNEENKLDVKVYPNPSEDNITISGNFTSEAQGIIVDQSGRNVLTFNAKNGLLVDISSLENGSYILKVTDSNSSITKTIVKL